MAQNDIKVKVVGKAGDKTIVGEASSLQRHPIYKKYVRKTKKYMIHDESNSVGVGEEIFIKSTRPISKRKAWVVVSKKDGGRL
jgi:small subunit ribosomal protein S17